MQDLLLPYLMAGLNMLAALIMTASLISPQTLLLCGGMIFLGIPISILLTQSAKYRLLFNIIALLPVLWLISLTIHSIPGFHIDWNKPLESFFSNNSNNILIVFLHMLTLTACARAFVIVSQKDLLQTPVPSMVIYMIVVLSPITGGAHEKNPLSLICLAVLIFTSLYLIGQLQSFAWFSHRLPIVLHWQMAKIVGLLLLIIFPLTMLAGYSLREVNMQNVSRKMAEKRIDWQRLPRFMQNQQGISLEQRIEIGGSGWPNGNQQIMTVETNIPGSYLWRATSYDFYQQGGWNSTLARLSSIETDYRRAEVHLQRYTVDSHDAMFPYIIKGAKVEFPRELEAVSKKTEIVQQHFYIQTRGISENIPVYGVFQIAHFYTTEMSRPVVYPGSDNSLQVPLYALRNATLSDYNVVSLIKPPPSQYKVAKNIPLPVSIQKAYLQMPMEGEFRFLLRKKALAILKEAKLTENDDKFRVMRAFESYLVKNYRYTLHPAPPEKHKDPIVDFLYYQKRGYCNYFSGSMVMLCRSVGIPARVVVGFASGEVELKKHSIDKLKYRYRVTADQAHSWVEIYLPNYGWYESDPTSGSSVEESFVAKNWGALTDSLLMLKKSISNKIAQMKKNPLQLFKNFIFICCALSLLLLIPLLRREYPPRLPKDEMTGDEARKRVLQEYFRMQRLLKRWKIIDKSSAVTAGEFAELFACVRNGIVEILQELTALYQRACYSKDDISDAEARRAIILLQQLWKHDRNECRKLRTAMLERDEDVKA